jgi:NADH-quinone oxidoreductase subunit L
MNDVLIGLIVLLPLCGAGLIMLGGGCWPRRVTELLAVLAVASATVASALAWPLASGDGTTLELFSWLQSGPLQVSFAFHYDRLAACMCLMVTGVATLIHIYAVAYLHKEPAVSRFFALLNLFVFAMLTLLLADNLLLLLLGWEGVGFCSYALIGYWYQKDANASAGRKAFLVTRSADLFLLIAILWLFKLTGTLNLEAINAQAATLPVATVTALGLLLLAGACGKSAQLPFMTWLPDAMAGPTPVSALIHAATMVTAGVYLLCRLFPLLSLSSTAMAAVATVGAITALYGAACALAQRDLKRLLAYSTMSQVGYMFLAVGAGTVSGALFHLLVHAFFKALLFMAAGCVIHLADGEQQLAYLQGVARRQPLLFWPLLAGGLCLAGVPLTGGFFSKDAILMATFTAGGQYFQVLGGLGLLAALLTALYSFRLLYVLCGRRQPAPISHKLPISMLWPLLPLALLGLGGGLLNLPPMWGGNLRLQQLLETIDVNLHPHLSAELVMAATATLLVLTAWLWSRHRYWRGPALRPAGRMEAFFLRGGEADRWQEELLQRPFRTLATAWRQFDEEFLGGLYRGAALLCLQSGQQLRRLTSGRLSHYLTAMALGLSVLLGWLLLQLLQS